jgi:hypothetical protein
MRSTTATKDDTCAMPRRPKSEQLLEPSITAVASRMMDGHMLRAVARAWPGGATDLYLERVDYGDEADPYLVERRVKVSYSGGDIESMSFSEDGVHFVSNDRKWFVRASSDAFSEKVIKDE